MRSHSFVKRTIPCLAVVLAVTVQGNPAHAGFLDQIVSIAAEYALKAVSSETQVQVPNAVPAEASVVVTNATEKKTVNEGISYLEKYLIQQVVSESKNADKLHYSFDVLRRLSHVEAEKMKVVNTETHTEIIPEYTEKGLTFRFRYDETALKNPQHIVKEMAVLSLLSSTVNTMEYQSNVFQGSMSATLLKEIESPHAIAELISNAREGSPTARARWVKIQILLLKDVDLQRQLLLDLQLSLNTLVETRQALESQLPALEVEAAQYARKQQKILERWRLETGALDKLEAMQEKLDDLILKNDRLGVRKLLEAYLPWTVMEPVEANAWRIWLEAIENPDSKNTTVAFRGLKYDHDKIQRRQTSQGEIFGFMSTVLTKNQGSYTRRLRSLTTNRVKNGDIGLAIKNSDILSVKVTDQMSSHARNPVASSFISFTYDPRIAKGFMGQDMTKVVKGKKVVVPYGGLLVVKMDSRRMVPNLSSMYSGEIELLAPLIIFPDEVVAYKEGSFSEKQTYEGFIKDVSEKTGIDFAQWKTAQDSNNINLMDRYNREGYAFLKQITDVRSAGKSCSKVF